MYILINKLILTGIAAIFFSLPCCVLFDFNKKSRTFASLFFSFLEYIQIVTIWELEKNKFT